MNRTFRLIIPLVALVCAGPALAADAGLSAKSDRVQIKVSGEVTAAEEKVKSIHDYKVLERVMRELESQMGGLPSSYRMEVVITGYRLRSGKSGFFGFSGADMMSAEITLRDKGKQIDYFSVEASNGKSGKTQPPTRRIITLVHRLGEKVGNKLNVAAIRGGRIPSHINIHIR